MGNNSRGVKWTGIEKSQYVPAECLNGPCLYYDEYDMVNVCAHMLLTGQSNGRFSRPKGAPCPSYEKYTAKKRKELVKKTRARHNAEWWGFAK